MRQFARLRTDWLTDIASPIARIGHGWAVPAAASALILALMVFKRWRHVFTFIGSLAVAELAVGILYGAFSRPRPYDVTIIGSWRSFTFPDVPVAFVTFVAAGIACTMSPPAWASARRPRSS